MRSLLSWWLLSSGAVWACADSRGVRAEVEPPRQPIHHPDPMLKGDDAAFRSAQHQGSGRAQIRPVPTASSSIATTPDSDVATQLEGLHLSELTCAPLHTFTRHPMNGASLNECVYDVEPETLRAGSLAGSAEYFGHLFRLTETTLIIASAEEEPDLGTAPAPLFSRCEQLFPLGAFLSGLMPLYETPTRQSSCKPRWRATRAHCTRYYDENCWAGLPCEPEGCPAWFWQPATMVVRKTERGYLLVVPPNGYWRQR